MRSNGSASALEARRRLAVQRVLSGQTQATVAKVLGVHTVTVAKWMSRHRATGDAGLALKPTPGRPSFLTDGQEQQVLHWLTEKATAHGFRTDLWTARRVADLIRRRLGVDYHPDYLRAWLRKRGYSPQKPRRRAKQKKQPVIDTWVAEDWPRIQKKRPKPKPISS
jgi:transposase